MQWGISYYPEWVPESDWETDVDRMLSAGLTTVRMLEFAWTRLEPREGEHDYAWLDRFLDLAQRTGIRVILGTPTAAVPRWLTSQYPQMLVELDDGTHIPDGIRRNVCVNNTVYREFSADIARRLGERYGDHPAVIGWQIDNELIGPEIPGYFECHCPDCQWRFRRWLKQRYASIRELNEAWWLEFWSLSFSDWGEVTTPRSRRAVLGHVLDHHRFYNDSLVEYLTVQADALRSVVGTMQWISHNSTGVFDRGINHQDFAPPLDVVGWDAYPGAASGGHHDKLPWSSMAHDLFRSAKHAPYWVFETASNEHISTSLFAQMAAGGADAILLWHFRAHQASLEMGGHRFADLDGVPEPRTLAKLEQAQQRLADLPALPDSYKAQEVALLFLPDCIRAEHRQADRPMPYMEAVLATYRPFWNHGVGVDVITGTVSLTDYRLLIMPAAAVLSQRTADAVAAFVEGGGVLLATGPTARFDQHGKLYSPPGAPVSRLTGLSCGSSAPRAVSPEIELADGSRHTVRGRCELVEGADEGSVAGRFAGGDLGGRVAVVDRAFGSGRVLYCCANAPGVVAALARTAAEHIGLSWIDHDFPDLQITPDPAGRGTWFINHGDTDAAIGNRVIPAADFVLAEHTA